MRRLRAVTQHQYLSNRHTDLDGTYCNVVSLMISTDLVNREVTGFNKARMYLHLTSLTDLNYRIDLPGPDIRNILRTHPVSEAASTLQKFDQVSTSGCNGSAHKLITSMQLNRSIRHNKAFDGFEEHSIEFLPCVLDRSPQIISLLIISAQNVSFQRGPRDGFPWI